jgi:ubiquinone/menaquinone biosynthesis C-methylase UbiE
MLPQAIERLRQEGLDISSLVLEEAIDFLKKQKSNSFDGLISVWVIHNSIKENQKFLLKEIYRVLKPGGVVVNGDKIVRDDLALYNEDFDWQIRQFELFKKIGKEDLIVSWKGHYEEDADKKRKITEQEYEKTLSDIGFSTVSFSDRNHLDVIGVAIK